MEQKYAPLFTPLQIGGIEIKNRIVNVPSGGTGPITESHKFNKKAERFWIERAANGIGLLIPGAIIIKSPMGSKWLCDNEKVFDEVKPFMEKIHAHGAKMFFQLSAGLGRSSAMNAAMRPMATNKLLRTAIKPIMSFDDMLVSADDGAPDVWMPEVKCRALTEKEIHEYVDAFGKTALLCKKAGVDGVEIHAVHEGYLIDQFTTKYTNHRTDAYGGSFENRYRFPVEIVQAIKKTCGKDFPVSLRYSVVSKVKDFNSGALPGEDYVEVGRDMEESERAIKYLEDAGYDMFNCDNGTYDSWYWAHPPVYAPLNMNLEEVKHIKKFTSKPVVCAGRMQFDTAAEAIAKGELDCVGMVRQFLCDCEAVKKIQEGRAEDIRPCISCHTVCQAGSSTHKGAGLAVDMKMMMKVASHCALNPYTLEEATYELKPSAHPRKIAVIGGGIGGMETAIQAAKRGHSVTLYEKTNELGGTFLVAAAPSFKEKDQELIEWYCREIKKYPIDVKMNTEIKSLDEIKADEIVIATGATPKRLPLPGAERSITAIEYLRRTKEVGDTVAIIGGGLTGCEVAYELALNGKHPFIIEMQNDLIVDKNVGAPNSIMMRDLLRYHKVPAYLESSLVAIGKDTVTIKTPEGEKTLQADSVISSVGFTAGTPLAAKSGKHVHILGDAAKVANLHAAIWGANDLVLKFQ